MKNLVFLIIVLFPLFVFSQLTPNEKNMDSLLVGVDWTLVQIEWIKSPGDSIFHKWRNKNDSLFYEFLGGEWKTFKPEFNPAPQDQSPNWQPGYHPERKDNETYWGNISSEFIESSGKKNPDALNINFNKISYKIKRLGKNAYDRDGNPIKDMRPVFIKMSE